MFYFKKFLLGIFFLIPTAIFLFLIYFSFFETNDTQLGIISIFGAFMTGAMCFTAFKSIFEDIIINKQNKKILKANMDIVDKFMKEQEKK